MEDWSLALGWRCHFSNPDDNYIIVKSFAVLLRSFLILGLPLIMAGH